MSTAPRFDIDVAGFTDDPYPVLAAMRAEAPIAYVPQLGATLFTRRADIVVCEKQVDVFSSDQPAGLMNRLMGRNMMRKDGREHLLERKAMFPALSPQTVRGVWQAQFQAQADRLLDALEPAGRADLVRDYALPLSGEALRAITGLRMARVEQIDAWSQAMIDGVANYGGDPVIEARCLAATAAIDASIDEALRAGASDDGYSILQVMRRAGVPMDSVRADIKLAISGGQNEPRDAIAGAAWALLAHPGEAGRALDGQVSWDQVFDEYVRWMSPIGMSPRRIARPHTVGPVRFEVDERIFFMFGSANRDEAEFDRADRFEPQRDTRQHIAFGAGPHFCAGAAAARTLIADVALPTLFRRLDGLRLADPTEVKFRGWAFRGPLSVPVVWQAR